MLGIVIGMRLVYWVCLYFAILGYFVSHSFYRLNRAAEAVRCRGNDGRLSMRIGIVQNWSSLSLLKSSSNAQVCYKAVQ